MRVDIFLRLEWSSGKVARERGRRAGQPEHKWLKMAMPQLVIEIGTVNW